MDSSPSQQTDPLQHGNPQHDLLARRRQIERGIITAFRRELWSPFTKALGEYRLVEDGDRIAVCVSGGKDSMLLAKLFQELATHGRKRIELEFLCMDPGYPEEARRSITANAELLGIPLRTVSSTIFEAVAAMDGNPCYPCARMRRGALYSAARDLGCCKIALGHHYDDVIETILMGILYAGQVKTMMPKIRSANYDGMELIRPLYLVREAAIERWRDTYGLSFIHCACPLSGGGACGSGAGARPGDADGASGQPGDAGANDAGGRPGGTSKRDEVKALIRSLAASDPYVEKSIFRSVENINLDAVVGWRVGGRAHSFLEHYDDGWGFLDAEA